MITDGGLDGELDGDMIFANGGSRGGSRGQALRAVYSCFCDNGDNPSL